ncbi:MAG: GNAT family N-acetyltransferase [Thermodesulfobacteriota bacterium]
MSSVSNSLEITGYHAGVIGKIVEMHALYYHEHWGFDVTFETQVARELSEFMIELDPARDGFWAALYKGRFAGSISIDGRNSQAEGARLRWFIVDPNLHGLGVGSALIQEAVGFCRKAGHKRIFLWTFQGLHAARKLYERCGFRLIVEHAVDQWGTRIHEQKFELFLPGISHT